MRISFALVLTVLSRLVSAQSDIVNRLNSELKDHSKEDTIRVNLLSELSYNYRWIDFCISQQYAEQSLKIANQLHFDKGIATADYRIAHCYWALGDNQLAIEKGLEAVAIAERKHFSAILGEGFQALGRSYLDQKEIKKAELYIKKAEEIALRTKNPDVLSRVYSFTGVIQFVKGKKDSALVLYKKALGIMQSEAVSRAHLSQVTSNIGECYLDSKPDLSFKYFNEAITIAKAKETRNKSAEAAISSIIGHALIKKGNYPEAERYLQESLILSRELGLKRSIR